jgi:leader peptidase (prepilin peptidase)/N-methyltransferase
MIDWDTQEIPDSLLIFATIIGIAYIAFPFFTESPNWLEALMGVAVGFIPLYAADKVSLFILKKDGFGYGDMKLMAVVGMFLGWQLILTAFYLAFITGSLYAIYLLLTKRIQKGGYFAFGPFLCLGILLAIWFGASINEWFATLYLAGW